MKEIAITIILVGTISILAAWILSAYSSRKYGYPLLTLENWAKAFGIAALSSMIILGLFIDSVWATLTLIIIGGGCGILFAVQLFRSLLEDSNWWIATCMFVLLLASGVSCIVPGVVLGALYLLGDFAEKHPGKPKSRPTAATSPTPNITPDRQQDHRDHLREAQQRQDEEREKRKAAEDKRRRETEESWDAFREKQEKAKRDGALVACMSCGKQASLSVSWWWVCDTCGYRVCSSCFSQNSGPLWKADKGGVKCKHCFPGILRTGGDRR